MAFFKYFLITALISTLFSYYLLNIAKNEGAIKYVSNKSAIRYFFVSIMLGWIAVPLMMGYMFYLLFVKN